jgi:hypothetical protein
MNFKFRREITSIKHKKILKKCLFQFHTSPSVDVSVRYAGKLPMVVPLVQCWRAQYAGMPWLEPRPSN